MTKRSSSSRWRALSFPVELVKPQISAVMIIKKGEELIKSICARAFMHVLFILVSITLFHEDAQTVEFYLSYLGLVCIFSRRVSFSWRWWYPTFGGLLFCLTLRYQIAMPLHLSILWGGMLSWIILVVIWRFSVNAERPLGLTDAIAGIFVIGAIFYEFKHVPLENLMAWQVLIPAGLIVFFLSNINWFKAREKKSSKLVPAEKAAVAPFTSFVCAMPAPVNPGEVQSSSMPMEYEDFYATVQSLRERQSLYPQGIRQSLLAIADSAENILQIMKEDPCELEYSSRFLRHFLPAVLNLADKHRRLARRKFSSHAEMAQALAKSEAMMSRLESAFSSKHYKLLRNDITDLSIEVDTLDVMLKIKGL